MKRSTKIYLEAARRIAEGEETYTCIAISDQDPEYSTGKRSRYTPERDKYLGLMEDQDLQCQIMNPTPNCMCGPPGDRRDLRVMLLLMAAEVLK